MKIDRRPLAVLATLAVVLVPIVFGYAGYRRVGAWDRIYNNLDTAIPSSRKKLGYWPKSDIEFSQTFSAEDRAFWDHMFSEYRMSFKLTDSTPDSAKYLISTKFGEETTEFRYRPSKI